MSGQSFITQKTLNKTYFDKPTGRSMSIARLTSNLRALLSTSKKRPSEASEAGITPVVSSDSQQSPRDETSQQPASARLHAHTGPHKLAR